MFVSLLPLSPFALLPYLLLSTITITIYYYLLSTTIYYLDWNILQGRDCAGTAQ